jgi:hypothetical protein
MAIKEKAIALAAKVAYVDGRVKPETANVLNAMGAAMEIPVPRMQEIAAFVKDASTAT